MTSFIFIYSFSSMLQLLFFFAHFAFYVCDVVLPLSSLHVLLCGGGYCVGGLRSCCSSHYGADANNCAHRHGQLQ